MPHTRAWLRCTGLCWSVARHVGMPHAVRYLVPTVAGWGPIPEWSKWQATHDGCTQAHIKNYGKKKMEGRSGQGSPPFRLYGGQPEPRRVEETVYPEAYILHPSSSEGSEGAWGEAPAERPNDTPSGVHRQCLSPCRNPPPYGGVPFESHLLTLEEDLPRARCQR